LNTIKRIKDITESFGGTFSLLWHNTYLYDDKDKRAYKKILQTITNE